MNEPTLPEGATKLVVDWFYGNGNFPEDTEFCQSCNGSGCDECIRGLEMEGQKAKVYTSHGHLKCPECKLVHMKSVNSETQPGVLDCYRCGTPSIITKETALQANAKKRPVEDM